MTSLFMNHGTDFQDRFHRRNQYQVVQIKKVNEPESTERPRLSAKLIVYLWGDFVLLFIYDTTYDDNPSSLPTLVFWIAFVWKFR